MLSLVLSGGFNEYVGCVLSAIISVLLIVKIAQNRNLVVNINITSLSIAVITLLYLISCFYAIDSGMAFVGFLKFLPVLLYMLLLMQDKGIKEHLIALLPYVALALGVLSLVLVFIPATRDYLRFPTDWRDFSVSKYLCTVLLVGELTALSKEKLKPIDIISALLLIILLLFTGSRAVFILAVFQMF